MTAPAIGAGAVWHFIRFARGRHAARPGSGHRAAQEFTYV